MLRPLMIGLGLFVLILGIQLFFMYELTLKTDIEKVVRIADFLPYSLVCVGLVVFVFGYQMQKRA